MKLPTRIFSFGCLLIIVVLLLYPEKACASAYLGLSLWYERMIPTLFPFMMISAILISYNMVPHFIQLFRPFFRIFFRLPDSGLYTIFIGFLCGFPMGAKTVSDLYHRDELSLQQANYLLGFCNNIGPVYFISFAYPLLASLPVGFTLPLPICLFGMYGIPLLYGILAQPKIIKKKSISMGSVRQALPFDSIITSNLLSLSKLAGYMIFFNMLYVLFDNILIPTPLRILLALFLEISGGLNRLAQATGNNLSILPLIGFIMLQFGGISCLFQTMSFTQNTPLSIRQYLKTKGFLTALTALYYLIYYAIIFSFDCL